jgi:hypothetical protein
MLLKFRNTPRWQTATLGPLPLNPPQSLQPKEEDLLLIQAPIGALWEPYGTSLSLTPTLSHMLCSKRGCICTTLRSIPWYVKGTLAHRLQLSHNSINTLSVLRCWLGELPRYTVIHIWLLRTTSFLGLPNDNIPCLAPIRNHVVEVSWFCQLLAKFRRPLQKTIVVYNDNKKCRLPLHRSSATLDD